MGGGTGTMGGRPQTANSEEQKGLLKRLSYSSRWDLIPAIAFTLTGTGLLLDKVLGAGIFERISNDKSANITDYIGIGLNYVIAGGFYLVYALGKNKERKSNSPIHH